MFRYVAGLTIVQSVESIIKMAQCTFNDACCPMGFSEQAWRLDDRVLTALSKTSRLRKDWEPWGTVRFFSVSRSYSNRSKMERNHDHHFWMEEAMAMVRSVQCPWRNSDRILSPGRRSVGSWRGTSWLHIRQRWQDHREGKKSHERIP